MMNMRPRQELPMGSLKAFWRVFCGCMFEIWAAPGAGKSLQKCGRRTPTDLKTSPGPWGRQDFKTAPQTKPARLPSGTQYMINMRSPEVTQKQWSINSGAFAVGHNVLFLGTQKRTQQKSGQITFRYPVFALAPCGRFARTKRSCITQMYVERFLSSSWLPPSGGGSGRPCSFKHRLFWSGVGPDPGGNLFLIVISTLSTAGISLRLASRCPGCADMKTWMKGPACVEHSGA